MFIGHNAVAFAGKRAAPRTSLGTLTMAAMWLDLIWPIFLILGIEHVVVRGGDNPLLALEFTDYPWTHSLVMSLAWSVAFGAVYWMRTRFPRGAVVTGAAVFSHWILDFVTHVPDLPVYPGGPKVGLGLWRSVGGTIVVESVLFVAGVVIYLRTTKPRDRIGSIGMWSLIVLLALLYVANFAPPPSNTNLIAWVALAAWLFPLWAWWADRHRA